MTGVELIVACAWKGTVILVAACAAAMALPRASAAMRHFVWAAAFGGLLLMPAVQYLEPGWSLPIGPPAAKPIVKPASAMSIDSVAVTGHAAHRVSWMVMVWAAGFAVSAGWFLMGFGRVRRMARRAGTPDFPVSVPLQVLVSGDVPVPMACGILRAMVILPTAARDWPSERLHAVLLHESMHIQRRDLMVQILGQAACCLYWFQPLVWLALRQLSKERERACDDAVLTAGIAAPDYASHLVEVARALGGWRVNLPAMAESSDLEGRVRMLLDHGRDRRPLSRRAAVVIAGALVAVLAPVAAIRAQAPPPAQPAAGSVIVLAGIVQDAHAARIPNCEVIVHSLDTPEDPLITHTDPVGIYRFAGLPPGRYTVGFAAPGLARLARDLTLTAGQPAELDVTLLVGSIHELITVKGQRTAPAPAAATRPQRVKVGGNVQASRLILQPPPVYPGELQQQGIQGSVVIKASISVTGEPINLQVINAAADPRLAQAALDSVRQWRYQPALLDGEPVETDTQITVDFRLDP